MGNLLEANQAHARSRQASWCRQSGSGRRASIAKAMNQVSSRSLFLGIVLFEELEQSGEGKGGRAGDLLKTHGRALSQLGGVTLEALTLASAADLHRSEADSAGVDAAGNAVLLLDIDLGEVEVFITKGELLLDISAGGAVNKVAHLEALDGLVLGAALGAVEATDIVRVSLVALVPTVVSSFDWHNLIIIPQHSILISTTRSQLLQAAMTSF